MTIPSFNHTLNQLVNWSTVQLIQVPLEMDDISIEPLCAPRIVRNWTNLGDTFAEDDKIMAAKVAAAGEYE